MTPLREAFVLPGVFLTVALLGGLRVSDTIRLLPPSLSAIVLAVVLISALVRAHVVVPAAFLDAERRPLENLSGAIVLLTLVVASAQAIGLVIPETGLLHFAFTAFLFVQFLSLSAAGTGRHGMLRSLFVLMGAFFVLRFIVLESLYAADGGALKRVLTALMAGVTLGGVEYQPHAAATGYAALGTLVLYMTGLVLMPVGPAPPAGALVRRVPENLTIPVLLLVSTIGMAGCTGFSDDSKAAVIPASVGSLDAAVRRDALLAAARVWTPPAVPPAAADLGSNPKGPGTLDAGSSVDCRLVLDEVGGLTSKFNCQLADGTTVKVKYGKANAELFAEVAATRLLTALGFPADRMYVVRNVQCAGCPRFPYRALRCLQSTGLQWPCFPAGLDFDRVRPFEPAVIERRLEGRKIEAVPDQGWAWYELDAIDESKGGSSRAEVDALKILAAFLAHWDNKAENQRLICPAGDDLPDGSCARPLAMLQDVGATFGPLKLELQNWRRTPVWADPRSCLLSMERLPWTGATFPEQQISERGRQFLLALLEQLSGEQVETLFTASRVVAFDGVSAEGLSAAAWTAAFLDKVRQIREAGPCPLEVR